MNGLIKQLFTHNSQVAQLSEHKTEDRRTTYWCWKPENFVKKNKLSQFSQNE